MPNSKVTGRFVVLHIGCHLSSSKGFAAMGDMALSIGADTFAFFTRNPRGGAAKAADPADAAALMDLCRDRGFARLVAHAPYTMNLCSADVGLREFACTMMKDDLARMELIPGNYYNFHPGSHTGQGVETGIDFIVAALNQVLPLAEHTTVLLETMAGKGSEIGRSFQELRDIIDRVEEPWRGRLGVCMDTCHLHDAGYDIINDLEGVLTQFDKEIGLERLRACHLNDSMNPGGSRKDRHARIGEGHIGLEALVRVVSHPVLRDLPFVLETPNELPGYAAEIKLLRERRVELT